VKRTLAIAIGLGVVLLVAVALAYNTWYCRRCGAEGKAFYHCTDWQWDQPAETWPGHLGPPPKPCPACGDTCLADSAWCRGATTHKYYASQNWAGY